MRIPHHPIPRELKRTARTAAEAFPRSTDYACAVTRFDRSDWRMLTRDDWVALACLVALLVAAPFIWPGLLALFR